MATQADDIRRIAKGQKIKGVLGSTIDRDPIPGTVTPYLEGSFAPTSGGGGSGTSNSTAGSTNSNGSTEQDGTQPTDGSDPNTFVKGGGGGGGGTPENPEQPSTGVQDVEATIDDDVQQTQKDDTNDSDTRVTTTGSTTGFTGMTDCGTGQCINIRLDGNFVPPDGWDDPGTPPSDSTFVLGRTFTVTTVPPRVLDGPYATFGEAVAVKGEIINARIAQAYTDSAYWGDIYNNPTVDSGDTESAVQNGPLGKTRQYKLDGVPDYETSYDMVVSIYGEGCSPSGGDPICPLTAPIATEWPTDGCYDLALIDGTFQTNQYDSEAPADAGGSVVDFCFGTDRTGRMYATAQGGVMLVETTVTDPATTYTAKVYASDGTYQAAGDATPQFMNPYLPQ